jgi:uncharacterized protein (DUF427 family)
MAKATWKGQTLAESDRYEVVEGNVYFPPESIRREYFQPSRTQTICGWKGTAHYYTVSVEGEQNPDAAWFYPDPLPAAEAIRGMVAFWHGVQVSR